MEPAEQAERPRKLSKRASRLAVFERDFLKLDEARPLHLNLLSGHEPRALLPVLARILHHVCADGRPRPARAQEPTRLAIVCRPAVSRACQ